MLGGFAILVAWKLAMTPAADGVIPGYGAVAMMTLGLILLGHGFHLRRTNPRLGIVERTRLPGESARDWADRIRSEQGVVEPPVKSPSSERARSK